MGLLFIYIKVGFTECGRQGRIAILAWGCVKLYNLREPPRDAKPRPDVHRVGRRVALE